MIKPVIKTIKISAALISLFAFLILLLWFKPQPNFPHHSPRDLPWQLPDFQDAKVNMDTLDNGQIHIRIEHLPLDSISPKMVSYFYKVLPVSTVSLNGRHMPLYHIFHPTEHGEIWVEEAALNGETGMANGALIKRKEWFGPFNSKGGGRVLALDEYRLQVRPEMFGLYFGLITHSFEPVGKGTRYTLESIIGSDLPVVGPLINFYIRKKMFSPEMLKHWARHQVQEVSSLRFFAAQLFEQQPDDHHFILNVSK